MLGHVFQMIFRETSEQDDLFLQSLLGPLLAFDIYWQIFPKLTLFMQNFSFHAQHISIFSLQGICWISQIKIPGNRKSTVYIWGSIFFFLYDRELLHSKLTQGALAEVLLIPLCECSCLQAFLTVLHTAITHFLTWF